MLISDRTSTPLLDSVSLLSDAHSWRFFYCPKMKFEKPATTFAQQLDILKSRGLTVSSDPQALRWLKRVSYYRLSAYFVPFRESGSDIFIKGTNFDEVTDLYIFDCGLRNLFMAAIERIEISFRTSITYELCHNYGPFGHTLESTYSSWFVHQTRLGEPPHFQEMMTNLEKEERRARELFINAYREKYTSEKHLPIWMATELMSFGTLSMMFEGLKSSTKTKIAAEYKLAEAPFQSWMHTLSSLRNFIAHHSRLWNRQFGVQPKLPHHWIYHVPSSDRTYCLAVMVQHLLTVIAKGVQWRDRLFAHLDRHPRVALAPMGFPDNWRELPPWRRDSESAKPAN
jgi:abortive infection bacteriophage resistance protein